ncbi:MAG: hypothetical protein CFE24_00420 [Flavobacterium sp. BFFFF2]|nr:MAG: hypothetical protein CFE24_00420 [Flavobacterium sp. BFFFF2]
MNKERTIIPQQRIIERIKSFEVYDTKSSLKLISRSLLLSFCFFTLICNAQLKSDTYLNSYSINKDSIRELTFKNKDSFQRFVKTFEEGRGFELPKFLIYDSSGTLLKHKFDTQISECGKGDVTTLKKKYYKDLPTLDQLNVFFNGEIAFPNESNYVVIFIWHQATDQYNKHTFETYKAWKEDKNLAIYFLNLE